MMYCNGNEISIPHKHTRFLYGFSQGLTLHWPDDGLANGPKLVTQNICNCVVQVCVLTINVYIIDIQ